MAQQICATVEALLGYGVSLPLERLMTEVLAQPFLVCSLSLDYWLQPQLHFLRYLQKSQHSSHGCGHKRPERKEEEI